MAISVQLRRGTSTQNSSFTGSVGEVVYTTDTKDLYVHDGTTQGGKLVGGGAASIADGTLTAAKMSWLGTVDEAQNSITSILSKQSDGDYDSVTPSGDVSMSQAGLFTIATDAVTTGKIDNDAVTAAKLGADTGYQVSLGNVYIDFGFIV